VVARAGACGGLAVVVLGTFLPWLQSGRVRRNSYAGGGAVRRLVRVGDLLSLVLHVWPFVALVAAAAIALLLLSAVRTGMLLAVVTAVYTGAVAVWALSVHADGLVRAADSGPIVTLAGATITLASLILGTSLDAWSGRAPR
jgi:hypothetical protein